MVVLLTAAVAAALSLNTAGGTAGSFGAVVGFSDPVVVDADGGGYAVFEGAGLRYVPGEPLRPVVMLYVPVPPGSEPVLEYSVTGYAPTGIEGAEAAAPLVSGEGLDASELAVPALAPPAEHAVLEGTMPLAGGRFAVVAVYPIAGADFSVHATAVEIRLTWDPAAGGIPVERAGLAAAIAPAGVLFWPTGGAARAQSPFWGRPWARICIGPTGGYRITGQQLDQAGCEVTGSPSSSLRLLTGPGSMFDEDPVTEHVLAEASITVSDADGDGIFDPEDAVSFVGRGLNRWSQSGSGTLERIQHRYAVDNVYWLTWGGENGRRIGTVGGAPGSHPDWGDTILLDAWFRQQETWTPSYETTTGWVWSLLAEGGSVQTQCGLLPPAGEGVLHVGVTALGSGSHTASVRVNGALVATDTWSGSGERVLDGVCPLSGSNTLMLAYDETSGDGELGLVYARFRYPVALGNAAGLPLFPSLEKTGTYGFRFDGVDPATQVYDITDLDAPRRLTGTEYSAGGLECSFAVETGSTMLLMEPSDWMQPDSILPASPGRLVGTVTDGDRLVVVPEILADGAWPLEAVAEDQGHVPVVATTREIYDEFGQGVADPGAIRSAVRWGMDAWPTGLQGVQLVGDGHYDMLHHATSSPVMVPPWITLGSSTAACVDDNFVRVHEDATLPEIPISRLPVDDTSELGVCCAKILEYASGSAMGTWTGRVLFAADDEWGDQTWNETEHTINSERLAEDVVPRFLDRSKFYLIEYPWPPGQWTPDGPHPEKPAARAAFIDTFGEGFGLVTYIGHGAPGQIAHEKLMMGSDVELLSNGSRLPVSLWGTCDVGRFDSPGTDAIGETMVLQPGGGSIASVAGTRGTFGGSNYALLNEITSRLYGLPGEPVGTILWLAKLAEAGSYTHNNRYYVHFGCGDLPLLLPDSGSRVGVEGDTLRTGELNHLHGSLFQDLGLVFVTVLESSYDAVYTCLGGAEIEWVKYGGTAYRGTQSLEEGRFELDCFVPLQAHTGTAARAAGTGIDRWSAACGAADPAVMIEGEPSGGDLTGPDVDLWIRGYEGVSDPGVTGEVTIEAALADSSGICILGGSGRTIMLFLDGDGTDVGRWFTYDQGASTAGSLSYTLEDIGVGNHEVILWSVDGLGNSSRDTLSFRSLESVEMALTDVLVYPNPGEGTRCFSFRVSEASVVTVTIFTVAGRRIDRVQQICAQGYNQILWDGLDRDGDAPASGSYVYRLEAVATGLSVFDRSTAATGILAVVRDQGD